MTQVALKNKITKSLDQLDDHQLHSAWLILEALSHQKKLSDIAVDEDLLNAKISIGIKQLENNEGIDFGVFLNEAQEVYGKK